MTSGGEHGVECHPDYWSCIFSWVTSEVPLETVLKGVADHLFGVCDAEVFVPTGFGKRHFTIGYKAPRGVTAGLRYVDHMAELWVEVKGEGCEGVTADDLRSLVAWTWGQGIMHRVTRLDVAWDHLAVSVDQVVKAIEADNLRTKAKTAWVVESRTLRGTRKDRDGASCYVGTRGSDRLLRVYDQHGFTRFELELHSERAQLAFTSMCFDQAQFVEGRHPVRSEVDQEVHARGLLMDFVEFIDKGSDSNITRAKRLPWWAAFVEGASKIRQVIPRLQRSRERAEAWVKRTVAPMLSALMAIRQRAGQSLSDAASEFFDMGVGRWTAWHKAMVAGATVAVADGWRSTFEPPRGMMR